MNDVIDTLKSHVRKLEARQDQLKVEIERGEWNLVAWRNELEATGKEIYSMKHTISVLERECKDG